jgi:hypothetical protein
MLAALPFGAPLTPTKTLSSPLLDMPLPTFGHAFIITSRLSGEKKQGILKLKNNNHNLYI